jgi:hypothetical protein
MRAILPALILLAFSALLAGRPAAQAETLGEARIGFSAERILVIDGRRFVGRMWQMPGVQRHEQELPAVKPVLLLFADRPTGDILLPPLHTAVPFTLPKAFALLGNPGLLRHPVGHEDIGGMATIRYAIDVATPEGRARGSLWLGHDGIPMRVDARFVDARSQAKGGMVMTIHWELRHLRIGPQPAALFDVPRGYQRLPAAAIMPLLGLRLPKTRRAGPDSAPAAPPP